jgi:hypothetical protein
MNSLIRFGFTLNTRAASREKQSPPEISAGDKYADETVNAR